MTRRDQILKGIVENFIKTAQPVGSKTLQQEYRLSWSSATIRSEMNSLEQDGYLEKTHTSSGRIPSAKGYQYYVEHLREERLDSTVKYALSKILDQKAKSVEEVMKESCQILADMTNLASVVLGPKIEEERLVSIQIIPIGNQSATAVFVTDQGYVENKTFLLEETSSVEEIQKTVALLNDRLVGTPIAKLVEKMEAMKGALTDYLVGQDAIYQAILGAFLRFAEERINLYGKKNLLNQPEFAEDARKLRRVLSLLDDPTALRKAMEASSPSEKENVSLSIGEEEDLEDVSILTANVQIPGGQNASISLLGPRSMDYDNAMAMLSYVSSTLDQYFNPEKKGDNECGNETKSPSKAKKTPPKKKKKN